MEKTKLKGAMMTFIVLQMCYLFTFFITFPDSFRNALGAHYDAAATVASWLSTLTMLGYCVVCLASVAMLVMRKPGFLLWFQLSGVIAVAGNFIVYVLRQVSRDDFYGSYVYRTTDYYWVLFIMALFWTVSWCMYFARSSRVFSYMGEDDAYLRGAMFTKKVKAPAPWAEPVMRYPQYPQYPQQGHPQQNAYPQQPYPTPQQPYSQQPPYPQQPYTQQQQQQAYPAQPQVYPGQYPGHGQPAQAYPPPQAPAAPPAQPAAQPYAQPAAQPAQPYAPQPAPPQGGSGAGPAGGPG